MEICWGNFMRNRIVMREAKTTGQTYLINAKTPFFRDTIFSDQLSYLFGPSKLSCFFCHIFPDFGSIVRSTTNSVAMANATACISHRNGMRWPLQPIAFFRAVVLHLPLQYIFISLCSISALPLAVLLLRDFDSLSSVFPFS